MKLTINNNFLELIKWLAIITMTVDHLNLFFFNREYEVLFDIGRLAFPLFVFLILYRIAEKENRISGYLESIFSWLLLSEITYQFIFYLKTGQLFEYGLSIMPTLFMLVFTVFVILNYKKICIFTVGTLVILVSLYYKDFFNYSYLFTFIVSLFFVMSLKMKKSMGDAFFTFWLLFIINFFGIILLNGNFWMVLSVLPFIFMGFLSEIKIKRTSGWFFYAYYPAHLFVLFIIGLFI